MKRRTLILLLAILAFITILRETGVVNVNFYNSRINMTNTNNWSVNNMVAPDTFFCKPMSGDCIPENISQISIVTFTPEGMFNTDKTRCEQLHIHLYYNNSGLYWLPLYKNFSFTATATCSDGITIKSNAGAGCIHHQFSGLINLRGHVTITGFCSYREVKRMITNAMVKAVEEIGENKLREL
jgi:hypothetical protein